MLRIMASPTRGAMLSTLILSQAAALAPRGIVSVTTRLLRAESVTRSTAVMDRGAREVHACCSHPVLSGPAVDRVTDSALSSLVVTDTIPLSAKAAACDKIKVLSIAPLVGEAIIRSHRGDSVTSLFV